MNFRYLFIPSALIFCLILISGCGSIVSGPRQEVSFASQPDGADVYVNGIPLGRTPLQTKIERRKGSSVLIKKEGFRDEMFLMTTRGNKFSWGNVIFLSYGVFSTTIDMATGALYEYAPNNYLITMKPAVGGWGNSSQDQHRAKVIGFIVVNHQKLGRELYGAPGEIIDALLPMLEVSTNGRGSAIDKLKQLYQANSNVAKFAELVVLEFIHR